VGQPAYWLLAIAGLVLTGRAAPEVRDAATLVAQLQASAAALQDYEVTGEGISDGKHSHYRFFYKRPDLVRIDTKDGEVSVQPNGEIRGRLGHGPFGLISRKLSRNDRRLHDAEGIPFWESHFPASVGRIEALIKNGGTPSMTSGPETYTLTVRSGDTTLTFVIDRATMFFRENSRSVNGKQVDLTRYSNYRPNSGLKASFFKF